MRGVFPVLDWDTSELVTDCLENVDWESGPLEPGDKRREVTAGGELNGST